MQKVTREIVVEGSASGFAQQITAGPHLFVADEPAALGGSDTGPNPYELLLGAIGSCTSMTIGLIARRHGYPLERVVVRARHGRVHAEDCANCEKPGGRVDRIEIEIELVGPALSGEQRKHLLDVAHRCPVKKTLGAPIAIELRAADASEKIV